MAQIYSSQPCECGCGQIANSIDRRLSRRRRFIHGHNGRLQPKTVNHYPPPNPSGMCMDGCGQQTERAKVNNGSLQVAGEFLRYRIGHWPKWEARRNPVDPADPKGPNPNGKCCCGCGSKVSIADKTDPAKQTVAGCYVRFLRGHDKITVARIGNPGGLCKCGCGLETPIAQWSRLGNIAETPQMYFPGHRWRTASSYAVDKHGCWILPVHRKDGYSRLHRGGKLIMGHRYYWEEKFGPIPSGMTLDHLCRVRACCNPDHMEVCTQSENSRRVSNHPEIPRWGDWNETDILVDPATGCHVFPIVQEDGYARFWMKTTLIPVHRFYYERIYGPIPKGLELDHTCCNRACVNPDHLEPVTHLENMRRVKYRGRPMTK